ncbi:MAG: MFS transporter [Bacteroidota bacterium]
MTQHSDLDRKPRKFEIFSWTLFDFANTAFSVIIVTVIYSQYFTDQVAGGRRWLWGLSVSLSMICAAVLSPPLGAAADFSKRRKLFLWLFTLACVICSGLMFFVQPGMIALGMLLFIIANIGFEGGLVFYDAFLPRLTSSTSYGSVSGFGFAMGYLGALAVLVIVKILIPENTDPDYYFYVRLSFVVAAIFFFIFSLPMFLFVQEPHQDNLTEGSFIMRGMKRSAETFRTIFIKKEHPSIARFLIAFFIYNDGIITVIAFAAIFAHHILHMSVKEIIIFFAIVQSTAILGSLIFGFVTDKIGPKKTIVITLFIWISICIGAYFITTVTFFYVVALWAGIAIGSSQSSSRSMMALLTPKEREAEFFGFYDGLCGKASAVVGPVVYGLISDLTNERVAALTLGLFFITGLWLLKEVKEPARDIVQN